MVGARAAESGIFVMPRYGTQILSGTASEKNVTIEQAEVKPIKDIKVDLLRVFQIDMLCNQSIAERWRKPTAPNPLIYQLKNAYRFPDVVVAPETKEDSSISLYLGRHAEKEPLIHEMRVSKSFSKSLAYHSVTIGIYSGPKRKCIRA